VHSCSQPATGQGGDQEPALPLPKPLSADLLHQLHIAEDYWPALMACQSVDDLIAAPVPESIGRTVFDGVQALANCGRLSAIDAMCRFGRHAT
jgi:hypothetical protein